VRVELHPEALAEIRSAALWYDEQRPGLGDDFVAEVTATLSRVRAAPNSFARWPQVKTTAYPIWRATTSPFPYAIPFEVHPDYVLVLAVAHVRRRPLYWGGRASPA
jgi:hypothetical protein